MNSRIAIIVFALLSLGVTMNRGIWKEQRVISWDGTGYYMYLPAAIIYHDLNQLAFYRHIDSVYQPSGSVLQYGIHDHSITGRRSARYPVGVALFELPGFVVADWVTQSLTSYPRDGYSAPYQLAVAISTICWAFFGLALLRRLLLRFYPERIVWKVLLLVAFGTNLYYHTAFLQGWSHAYSFFLFAAVLYLTESWYRQKTIRWALLLGLTLGLVAITRPSNMLILVFPLLWPLADDCRRMDFFRSQLYGILAASVLFVGVLCIQMAYWKYVTGHWVYYSYTDEGFDFLHPKIWRGLFSYRKGWFVYTPLALVFCCGLLPLFRRNRSLSLPFILFVLANIYIVFSWKIWHYGGGFSCRPMTESIAVLALPACALLHSLTQEKSRIFRAAGTAILMLLIGLNMFQTYQFSLGVIHYDRMTREYYWRVFGKLHVSDADRLLLRPGSEDEPDK